MLPVTLLILHKDIVVAVLNITGSICLLLKVRRPQIKIGYSCRVNFLLTAIHQR